ncbi:hypothetical protein ACN079_26390 [Pseudomonas sp. ABY48]|uniref:hypothetical protein n=1 Tax=Pseudomonas sp. ABY48 TaxID=3402865 RepID=UPI003B431ED6
MDVNQSLSDEQVSRLEGRIPAMAKGAIKAAYINTLAAGPGVMEIRDSMLVETTADGPHAVIRMAKPKHKEAFGGVIKVNSLS